MVLFNVLPHLSTDQRICTRTVSWGSHKFTFAIAGMASQLETQSARREVQNYFAEEGSAVSLI